MAQPIRTPDIEAQRAAMKKLDFLIGQWAGEASVLRGPGQWVEMIQTEEAQHKLDGVVLLIEGVGRAKSEVMPDGKPVLQALGMVSFDDETETYRMRAFNDGRFLETEVTLVADNPSPGVSRWEKSRPTLFCASMTRVIGRNSAN
ncbi:MAG TPA: hypothetical protein VHY84_25160 [Bryobacteraceae bacterium]|jgi:hypothetical protein|nr:hypothetical protein [Bryobacteraceae bacterium]